MKNVLECLGRYYSSALGSAKLFRRWAKETGDDEATYLNWKCAFQNLAIAKEFKKAMQILSDTQMNNDTPPQLNKHDVSCWQEYLIEMMNKETDAVGGNSKAGESGEHIKNAQAIQRVLRLISENPPACS